MQGLKQPVKNIRLTITEKGVFLIDAITNVRLSLPPRVRQTILVRTSVLISVALQEMIKECPIREVTFVAMDATDKKLFSFITTNKSLGLIVCHTFSVKSRVCILDHN